MRQCSPHLPARTRKGKTLQGSHRFPAHHVLLSHPAEPDPPIWGAGGRSGVTRVPGIALQAVGRSWQETAAHWWPQGGKRSNTKVARCRQTCKSAAARLHRQPPNCCDGNLLIATPPLLSQGRGQGGKPGGTGRSQNPPARAGDVPWGQGHPGTARVPRGVGMAQLGPQPSHTGHCLAHTNLSLPPAKKN